jgi:gamma-glutamylputrescine oxidase
VISYWERENFTSYDYIIIGAGIVGINVAIELSIKEPNARIVILERGFLSTGASSRNAGFACIGSLTELLDDLKCNSLDVVMNLLIQRKNGLKRLRNRLGDENIGFEKNGSYELIDDARLEQLGELDRVNNEIKQVVGLDAFEWSNAKIATFGFNNKNVKALISNKLEGQVHTGKLLKTLMHYATQNGIEIKTGAEVSVIEDCDTHVNVIIPDQIRKTSWNLKSKHVFVCTNAFTNTFYPELDITPGRGQVLITHPICNLPFKGVFHMDGGYIYFRELEGRVLIGGARNQFFKEETSSEIKVHSAVHKVLEELLVHTILPKHEFEVDLRWAGIMAFGASKKPIVELVSRNVHLAVRMNGMGVAIGSEIANKVVEQYYQNI